YRDVISVTNCKISRAHREDDGHRSPPKREHSEPDSEAYALTSHVTRRMDSVLQELSNRWLQIPPARVILYVGKRGATACRTRGSSGLRACWASRLPRRNRHCPVPNEAAKAASGASSARSHPASGPRIKRTRSSRARSHSRAKPNSLSLPTASASRSAS